MLMTFVASLETFASLTAWRSAHGLVHGSEALVSAIDGSTEYVAATAAGAASVRQATHAVKQAATTDRIAWTPYTGNESPPPSADAGWTFGVIDKQHLVLFMGTGSKQLVTLGSAQVWQASAAENLTE